MLQSFPPLSSLSSCLDNDAGQSRDDDSASPSLLFSGLEHNLPAHRRAVLEIQDMTAGRKESMRSAGLKVH